MLTNYTNAPSILAESNPSRLPASWGLPNLEPAPAPSSPSQDLNLGPSAYQTDAQTRPCSMARRQAQLHH